MLLCCGALVMSGCADPKTSANNFGYRGQTKSGRVCRSSALSAETRRSILALDPEHVTEREIKEVLSRMPAPRIINIHGGLLPLKATMNSFGQFLIGMGYPEASVRDPADGSCTYGYYDRSDKIAGTIAWYYEQDGMRPMIVGHSLGGIQAVRVLHKLAGESGTNLSVWNPLTRHAERRDTVTDPFTGLARPVVGLKVSYASVAVAGGLGRILPNEWDMNTKLRKIPDSVEEFTGFQKGFDVLGGDFLGYGHANEYQPAGRAMVRNVRLPSVCPHSTIPDTKDLLKSPEIKDWINNYQPIDQAVDASAPNPGFGLRGARILWAAEVWHGIKKHWVLELQHLVGSGPLHDHAE